MNLCHVIRCAAVLVICCTEVQVGAEGHIYGSNVRRRVRHWARVKLICDTVLVLFETLPGKRNARGLRFHSRDPRSWMSMWEG